MKRIFWPIVLYVFVYAYNQLLGEYIIRDANYDDKNKILALYRRCNKLYQDYSVDSNYISNQIVSSKLLAALNHGFAFVVEDVSDENKGAIIAFLLKNRPMGKAYCHIIDSSLSAVDSDFKNEMLMRKLYMHMLMMIQEFYPVILRVEGICSASSIQMIEMFEFCGFEKEATRAQCVRRLDGSFDDELLFVWWNPNFDFAARD